MKESDEAFKQTFNNSQNMIIDKNDEEVPLKSSCSDSLKSRPFNFNKKNNFPTNDEKKISAKPTIILYLVLVSLIFLGIIFMFFYIHYGRYHIELLVSEKEMIKPLVDDRKYRAIKLTNNLDSLMISDVSSSTCSASMSVGVGSFQDDEDMLGLAHFTEHMIFLGSKSFPKPGEFEDHLSNYFGMTNAFTEDEKTTFYFEIGCGGFQKALVMFSRMFSEPLFDLNYMSKEINAVNSENDKNLNQDPWREHQLIKNLSNPKHPYNRFNTGNNKTLSNVGAETLNKRLNAFYAKYYTPGNMKLVVLANQNLDSMQSNAAQYFSDIRLDSLQKENNFKYGDIRTTEKAYTQKEMGKVVWFQKLSPGPNLDIIFVIDEILSTFQFKPIDYISYLLKFSGEGSLVKYLKEKKFASKVDAGVIANLKNFTQFGISITLTEYGLAHVIPILDAAFNYINLIKSQNVSSQIYSEIHNMSKTRFKFLEKNDKFGDYLASIANSMFDYTYRELLYGDYLHSYFNETLIRNYINMIVPENSLVIIGSDKYPQDNYLINSIFKNSKNETETWYKTQFIQAKLADKMLNILRNEKMKSDYIFKTRPKNEFVTKENNIVSCLDDENKDVCSKEMRETTPNLYLNLTNFKVWYKMDRSFLVPRVNININIVTPLLRTYSKDYLALNILFNYLSSNFDSIFSDLKETGNELQIKFNENGFILTMTLFSDLVNIVTDKLFTLIFNPIIDESSFNEYYTITMNEIKTFSEGQPYKKSREYFSKIVKENATAYIDVISMEEDTNSSNSNSKKMNYTLFKTILNKVVNSLRINSLFYGYIKQSELDFTIDKIKKLINKNIYTSNGNSNLDFSSSISTFTLVDYLHSHKIIKKPVIFRISNDLLSEQNHIVQNYFQIGMKDYKKSMMMNLIEMIWGNMFYFTLRTQKQLGYIVTANKEFIDNFMYFVFVVQGNKKTPSELNLEIDNVLWRLRDKIISLQDAKFKEVIASYKTELIRKDGNLKERTKKVWAEIYENSQDFTRKEKLGDEISKINKGEILEFFDDVFIDKPHKLSIQIYAPNTKFENENEEVYYLNANVKYKVTSDVNVLKDMKGVYFNEEDY